MLMLVTSVGASKKAWRTNRAPSHARTSRRLPAAAISSPSAASWPSAVMGPENSLRDPMHGQQIGSKCPILRAK
jgi:hypothetical protein